MFANITPTVTPTAILWPTKPIQNFYRSFIVIGLTHHWLLYHSVNVMEINDNFPLP